MTGVAGTGKSLLALAVGFLALEKKETSRLLVFKPVSHPVENVGYLPGELDEKEAPYMTSIGDVIGFLEQSNQFNEERLSFIKKVSTDKKTFLVGSVFGVKGRTLSHSNVFVDEGQDYSPQQMKALLTRAGEGTRFFVAGDVGQSGLGDSNGLSYAISKLKGEHLCRVVHLHKCYRSPLAEMCGRLL